MRWPASEDAEVMPSRPIVQPPQCLVTYHCSTEKVGLRRKSPAWARLFGANIQQYDGTAFATGPCGALLYRSTIGQHLTFHSQLIVVSHGHPFDLGPPRGIPEAGL